MIKLVVILGSIIILGLLGIYYKILYNRLMANKIKIDEANQIINDSLKKRYDYVIRTSHLIKKNLNLDIEQFKEIETLKIKKVDNNIMDEKLTEAYKLILQLQEDYPQLSENRGFHDIINDFEESNEMLEAAKSFYDKYAFALNEIIKDFPSNIVAAIHKIKKVEYYNSKTEGFNNEILDSID